MSEIKVGDTGNIKDLPIEGRWNVYEVIGNKLRVDLINPQFPLDKHSEKIIDKERFIKREEPK